MSKKKTKKFEAVCRFPSSGEDDGASKMSEITWRVFRIMAEFVEGFQFLTETSREVTIFGSARLKPASHWYRQAEKLGRLLAKHGFTVITGGGPGVMEAANKGATESGGESIGLNIQLPTKQRMNRYVKKGLAFYYFFTRKVMMAASAQAYVFFPGGFGTIDEFFEIVMLIQTGKAQKVPIVCLGHDFWDPLDNWLRREVCQRFEAINVRDTKLYTVVDSAEEALALVKDSKERTIF